MTMRKCVALATAALALGSGLAVLPATGASAATTYTCNIVTDGYREYAGYYSGNTVVPSATGVSSAGIEAQCLLDFAGYAPGPIDGVFGTKSKAAAKAFQKAMNKQHHTGLDEDGIVGAETWPVLRYYAF
jgi:hypothetical protein